MAIESPPQQPKEEEEEDDDEEEEEEEEILVAEFVETDPAKLERIRASLKAEHDADFPRMMNMLAHSSECARKHNYLLPPPLAMMDYPDLFERAWGWDMLLPIRSTDPWSKYKEYLSTYYSHNIKKANAEGDDASDDDDGNGNDLPSLARLCIEMEGHLLFLWRRYATLFPDDDYKIRQVSGKVTKHALEMVDALEPEFPAAAVSLKCITKEAEVMCGWLILEDPSPIAYVRVSNEICECALNFMFYKRPEPKYVFAMAAMVGIMKEAKLVYRYLWNLEIESGSLDMSLTSRDRTLGVMLKISDECFAVEDSTGGTTGERVSNESDGNNFSDKLEDKPNANNFSMTGLAEQGSLVDMNDTGSTKMGSEMEGVKKDDTVKRTNGEDPIFDRSAEKKNLMQKDDKQERDNINQNIKIILLECFCLGVFKND